jgi:hypothetical protein
LTAPIPTQRHFLGQLAQASAAAKSPQFSGLAHSTSGQATNGAHLQAIRIDPIQRHVVVMHVLLSSHEGTPGEVEEIMFLDPEARDAYEPLVKHDNVAKEPAEGVSGLARLGYSTAGCLICRNPRSAVAILKCSDQRGYGLCENCGQCYEAWKLRLSVAQADNHLPAKEAALADEFNAILNRNFHRDDDDARRFIGLAFLSGQFASKEWEVFTRLQPGDSRFQ